MPPDIPLANVSHRLFVYGTLAPGRCNHHVVQHLRGTWEEGEVNGTLYEQGIGPTSGYPALDLDEHGPPVKGYLLTSSDLPACWPRIDEFEGDGYRRTITAVRTSAGVTVAAYIYALDRDAQAQ
jgi:gamma-glutamylcyclotransferase (GGCT)/AIG2-like uncharacterized protein YtfP